MLARRANLPVRILLTVVVALGPPVVLIGLVPAVLPPGASDAVNTATIAALIWFTFAFFTAPAAFLFDLIGPAPDDDGGGGGLRLGPTPPPPAGPGAGGPPLPDAQESNARLREPGRPKWSRPARRRAKEPERPLAPHV
jgi:hypothetical protein